jgi:hypothetical protein
VDKEDWRLEKADFKETISIWELKTDKEAAVTSCGREFSIV